VRIAHLFCVFDFFFPSMADEVPAMMSAPDNANPGRGSSSVAALLVR
jgi:hypothetical protein